MATAARKTAIITGASSGIGRGLALALSRQGYTLGLAARRMELLQSLQAELPGPSHVRRMDVSDLDAAREVFAELDDALGGAELVVLNAGTGYTNPRLDWDKQRETLAVNVMGFAALANAAMHRFLERKRGHLVGVSSIAGLRGSRYAPSYAASKACVSNLLEGLRCYVAHTDADIAVTEILPGFVDTAMAQSDHIFWCASVPAAVEQIATAIRKRRKRAYITRRWRLIAWALRLMPDFLYRRT